MKLSSLRLVLAAAPVLFAGSLSLAQSYAPLGNNPVFSATGGTAIGTIQRAPNGVLVLKRPIHAVYPVLWDRPAASKRHSVRSHR